MHYSVTRPNPTEVADLQYIHSQLTQVGTDASFKMRGADGETKWMCLTPAQVLGMCLTPAQVLAVQEALKPGAFNPITVSITANTLGEALLLWCYLGITHQPIMDLADAYLTPEQVTELRDTIERKYGGTYPIWDTLDDMLRADGIIGA